MSSRFPVRLVPLGGEVTSAPDSAADVGAKAARLMAGARAGLPVLPGWVLPVAGGHRALAAGAAAVRGSGLGAGRRAVLGCPPGSALADELREAVARLGGRVIVRSSSPLESDPRWGGAFSSVAEVGPDDVVNAVRSCWASAFAVDPLTRLESSGLPLSALGLGIVIQPEIVPVAGGVARVAGGQVTVEGVHGHPGALLSGWAEGASARIPLAVVAGTTPAEAARRLPAGDGLASLLGADVVAAVAGLASRVHHVLGDDVIEWAMADGGIWLLQSLRSAPAPGRRRPGPIGHTAPRTRPGPAAPPDLIGSRDWMPLLASVVWERGQRVPASPAGQGVAAGRLVACRPHERVSAACRDAILLVDRPVPALAPLVFAARGVIARTGAAGSHLAEVARSLGVPMVIGCHPGRVTAAGAPADGWLAAIDGAAGEVAVLPATEISRAVSGTYHQPGSQEILAPD